MGGGGGELKQGRQAGGRAGLYHLARPVPSGNRGWQEEGRWAGLYHLVRPGLSGNYVTFICKMNRMPCYVVFTQDANRMAVLTI